MTTDMCISDSQDYHGPLSMLPYHISLYSSSKPANPPCVLVRVSPVHVQHMPLHTRVSRGCSPVPIPDLLPQDLAEFFNSVKTQNTQGTLVHYPIHLADEDVVSKLVTSCKLDNVNEGPSQKCTTQAYSPDIVPDSQGVDYLVCPSLFVIYNLLTQFSDGSNEVEGT